MLPETFSVSHVYQQVLKNLRNILCCSVENENIQKLIYHGLHLSYLAMTIVLMIVVLPDAPLVFLHLIASVVSYK